MYCIVLYYFSYFETVPPIYGLAHRYSFSADITDSGGIISDGLGTVQFTGRRLNMTGSLMNGAHIDGGQVVFNSSRAYISFPSGLIGNVKYSHDNTRTTPQG